MNDIEHSEKEVFDLIKYFRGKNGPNETVENRIYKRIAYYQGEDRKKLIDWLLENQPQNYGIDIHKINEGVRELGIDSNAHDYISTQEWICDCCGLKFKYAIYSSYDDKFNIGIFDYCPRCGLPPHDTITAKLESRLQRGKLSKWYINLVGEYKRSYDKRGSWIFDKAEDERYDKTQKAKEVDMMKKEIQQEIKDIAEKKVYNTSQGELC